MRNSEAEGFKAKAIGFLLMLVIGFAAFSVFGVIILILLIVLGVLPNI
ncbi:MAG TPA: hypothetical protein VMW25_03970 [Clostridia bacterium]|nr:hypothetical protein [Clostridia bacterium]